MADLRADVATYMRECMVGWTAANQDIAGDERNRQAVRWSLHGLSDIFDIIAQYEVIYPQVHRSLLASDRLLKTIHPLIASLAKEMGTESAEAVSMRAILALLEQHEEENRNA
jgi:hypothetical protein